MAFKIQKNGGVRNFTYNADGGGFFPVHTNIYSGGMHINFYR